MGLEAQLIAIGAFSAEVLPALEYPAKYYADVKAGSPVITNLFVAATSEESHKLAEAFGIGAMEFAKHHVDAQTADLKLLEELFQWRLEKFLLLKKHHFNFYYLPSG